MAPSIFSPQSFFQPGGHKHTYMRIVLVTTVMILAMVNKYENMRTMMMKMFSCVPTWCPRENDYCIDFLCPGFAVWAWVPPQWLLGWSKSSALASKSSSPSSSSSYRHHHQVGGILCPYVNMLSDAWVPAPNIIYGGLAVLGNTMMRFDYFDDEIWW